MENTKFYERALKAKLEIERLEEEGYFQYWDDINDIVQAVQKLGVDVRAVLSKCTITKNSIAMANTKEAMAAIKEFDKCENAYDITKLTLEWSEDTGTDVGYYNERHIVEIDTGKHIW